ncbi:hypothetical protein H7X68_01585 [Candidatus Saccharibacteria bacterium]|nr:hypothetical protein [Candidatus Saccharibacteria bacterium]
MSRYNKSRTFPIALVLIIVAVAIAALISVTRAIFFSGDNQSTTQTDVSQDALISTAADREVRMTVRGAIVANEDFHSYLIAITPSSRVLSAYTGYMDKNVDQQVGLGNNIPAYEELVYALSRANLVKGTELTDDQNDTRGICATGLLYRFEILKNNRPVKNLWTSTCKGSKGSLDASVDQLKALFIAQIPDAPSRISKIDL